MKKILVYNSRKRSGHYINVRVETPEYYCTFINGKLVIVNLKQLKDV